MQKTIKLDADRVADWLVVMVLTTDAFRAGFNFILSRFGAMQISPLCTTIVMLAPLVLLLISERGGMAMKRVLPFLIVLMGSLFYFLITLLFHPNYAQYIIRDDYLSAWESVFRPDSGALWFFLAFSMIRDPKRILNDMRIAAYIMLLYGVYRTVTHNNEWQAYDAAGRLITLSYSLNYGYQLMFGCIILINSFLMDRKHWYDLLAAAGIGTFALSQGSRGAFVCLAVYGVLFILTQLQHMPLIRRLLLGTALAVTVGLLIVNLDAILLWLQDKLGGYGGNSRLINMFLAGDISSNSGRDKIYAMAWDAIEEQGIFGNGAYGSRWIIAPRYFWGYPHNIYLELVMETGLFIGTLLFAWLLYKMVKTLFTHDNAAAQVMCILTAMSVKLVISDSFWSYGYFWAMLGFMYAARQMNHIQVNSVYTNAPKKERCEGNAT